MLKYAAQVENCLFLRKQKHEDLRTENTKSPTGKRRKPLSQTQEGDESLNQVFRPITYKIMTLGKSCQPRAQFKVYSFHQ